MLHLFTALHWSQYCSAAPPSGGKKSRTCVQHLGFPGAVQALVSARVTNLQPVVHMQSIMAVNEAQQKIINLLTTLWDLLVTTCCNVFNVWPKTDLLLPVWHRDAKGWDTPGWSWALMGTNILLMPESCWGPKELGGILVFTFFLNETPHINSLLNIIIV